MVFNPQTTTTSAADSNSRVQLNQGTGRCRKNIKAAAVMADEKIEQLRVQAFWIGRDFMDLHARLDIDIVTDVAVLKIEIEQANAAAPRSLRGLELDADFDRKRAVADAAGARHEGHHDRFCRCRLSHIGGGTILANP